MSETYAYIELLPDGCRWALIGRQATPDFSMGDQAEAIEWALQMIAPVVLVIPGEQVVVRRVPYSEKEKRHFAKLLPYELEEEIIENFEDLHFAISAIGETTATVAYINNDWFFNQWQAFSEAGVVVQRCLIDFQQLPVEENSITVWLSPEGQVLANTASGIGFSVTEKQAPIFLQGLLSEESEQTLTVYNVSEKLPEWLEPIANHADATCIHAFPEMSLSQPQLINLCCGSYQYRPPLSDNIKGFKSVLIVAVAAIVSFIAVNWYAGASLQSQHAAQKQKIEALTRQVIPRGNINDPVTQLTQKLGQPESAKKEPSQLMYLLSRVSPVISELETVLISINYSDKDKSLRMSVQADSFDRIEGLRKAMIEKGLEEELLSSNAIDDQYQARLRINRVDL